MAYYVRKSSMIATCVVAAITSILLGRYDWNIGESIPIKLAASSLGTWHHNITECSKDRLGRLVSIRSRIRSNCPDRSPWWLKFAGELSEGRSLTHVNIGCNKGFDFLATSLATIGTPQRHVDTG